MNINIRARSVFLVMGLLLAFCSFSSRTAEAATTRKTTTSYPYVLSIPSIKVNAGVRAMGVENGRMAVPNNYFEVGWYKFSAVPGEIGNAVMGAHVDNGGSVAGVFKNLKHIKVGNKVYITSKNKKLTYKVTKIKVYDRMETNTDAIFGDSSKSRLNIITCYGMWLKDQNTYTKRLVVFTERVS